MRLILEVISGPFEGKQIEAKVGEIVRVGRVSGDVAMDDNFMSGQHFAIECDLRNCRLRDLNSRNGTQLNGKLITEAYLTDGDQVHAGKTDFKVRIEDFLKTAEVSPADQEEIDRELANSKPPPAPSRKRSKKLPPSLVPEPAPPSLISQDTPNIPEKPDAAASTSIELGDEFQPQHESHKAADESGLPIKTAPTPVAPSPPPVASSPSPPELVTNAVERYEAATLEGRLIQVLSSQPGSLMALVDAIRDARVFDLIRGSSKGFHSLYRSEQNAASAPHLVEFPPRSELLKQMVKQGWGHEWGVYLTSPLSPLELREFFRRSLMVTMPDGMELFSRFYDPRFFRAFLETCTAPEAEKFFGPITSYFMEDERPEILLQFSRSKRGAEKRGHLLSVLP